MSAMRKEDRENILANIIFPSRPTILLKLQQAQEQGADNAQITELISQDISLSAALLKTINAADYGLSENITSLKQAVSLLGIKQVSILVTGLSLQKIISDSDFDMFWSHSLEIASISALIAQQLDGINVDDAWFCGLFHDCGKVLLSQQLDGYQDTLNKARGLGQSVVGFENYLHGTDHALVGAFLSHAWGLPATITAVIRHHHDIKAFRDNSLPDYVLSLLALLHLTEYLVYENNDNNYNERAVYVNECMEYLNITKNVITDFQSQVNQRLMH
jgi:putative nucleotidyltransferase with HDIG domain